MHVYEIRPRKDKRGVDLISDTLPFGHLWYAGPNAISNAIGYAKFYDAVGNGDALGASVRSPSYEI
jgi:hypothetical protein